MKFIDPTQDRWRSLGCDADIAQAGLRDHVLIDLEQWLALRGSWPAALATGVVVPNSADVDTLATDLPRLRLVVLQFPKFTDGRAYTQARLLRRRLHYRGEVRARGDVLVDMLPLLQRTGFDAVQLRRDQKLESARRALGFFHQHYQRDAWSVPQAHADLAGTEVRA